MDALDHDRRRNRLKAGKRRRWLKRLAGLLLLGAGYSLLGVEPGTSSGWILLRLAGGFALIVLGFWLAILPMLSKLVADDD